MSHKTIHTHSLKKIFAFASKPHTFNTKNNKRIEKVTIATYRYLGLLIYIEPISLQPIIKTINND